MQYTSNQKEKTNINSSNSGKLAEKKNQLWLKGSGVYDIVARKVVCFPFLQVYTCKKPKAKWVGIARSLATWFGKQKTLVCESSMVCVYTA